MATVNKDFKIKQGLVVEGATGTINGENILTEGAGDQYIINLIGGSATSENTPDTVVLRDEDGNFAAGTVTVNQVTLGSAGYIQDDGDGDLEIVNTNNNDVVIRAEDIRLNSTDDIRLTAGTEDSTNADLVLSAEYGEIRLESSNIYVGGISTDEQRVATQGYVDTEISNLDLTYNTDDVQEAEGAVNLYFTDFRAQTAVSNALGTGLSYGDQGSGNVFHVDENVISTKTYANAAADAAYANAQGYAELKASDAQAAAIETASQDATTKANNAQSAAESFATQAIADLVDSAPATLDTLNELAAALQDNPDIIGDLQTIAAGKQDTLTAGDNISIDQSSVISVTGLDTADVAEDSSRLYFTNQRALDATSAAYDAAGAAQTAEDNAIAHADALTTTDIAEGDNLYFTNQRAIDAVGGTIGDQIDLLTTDDIEEGEGNLYFTDSRAKTSAADLLTGATLSNITITGTGAGLTITAENGVAGSTTDDLTEGEENLYFNDERAIDAVSGADIYPNAVIINNLTKQVANQVTVATAGIATGISWVKESYRSAEFVVKVAYGDHTEISKVLLTLDVNDNIAITEYGNVTTNGSASSISADISGTDARLRVTTVNNNSTVTVLGTLIA